MDLSEPACPHSLTPELRLTKFRQYGFEECSTVLAFLGFFVFRTLIVVLFIYILSKTEEYLRNHDNGSDYFIDLRSVADDIRTFLKYLDVKE